MSRGIREPARPHRGELVYFQEHEQGSPGGIPGPSTESGQVMRDLKIHTAGQNGPVSEEERQRWKQLISSYLFGTEELSKAKRPLQHRVAAHDLGLAVDNVLHVKGSPIPLS